MGATVSVIVPTYNRARLLRETLNSILDQTRPPTEVIVVDDGSTDDTAAVCAAQSPNVRYVWQSNTGLPAIARNRGISEATGEWIALCDSDDIWTRQKLETQFNAIAATGARWCVTGFGLIDPDGARISTSGFGFEREFPVFRQLGISPATHFGSWLRRTELATAAGNLHVYAGDAFGLLFLGNACLTSTALIERSLLAEAGSFDPKYIRAEDTEFFHRLSASGDVAFVMDRLIDYRVGHASVMSAKDLSPFMRFTLASLESATRLRGTLTARERGAYEEGRQRLRMALAYERLSSLDRAGARAAIVDGWNQGDLRTLGAFGLFLATLIPSAALRGAHSVKRGLRRAIAAGSSEPIDTSTLRSRRSRRRREPRRPSEVKQRIAITDGEQRAALALTRSLGRAGHHVIVLSTRAHSLAGSSRFAGERCVVSDPLSAPAAYLEDVRSVLRSRSVDVLLPVSEASLRAILPQSEALAPSLIPFAPDRTFRDASDKSLVLAAAARLGISTPRQVVLRRRGEEDRSIVQARLRFPLAVKPTRSVSERPLPGRRQGTLYVGSPADFDAVIGNLGDGSFPLLVQERIIGPGIGVFVLLWNGTLHAAFAHRRIREKPPSGGVSVLSESMPLDPGLLARSIALLREFDWAGVAMVEYKVDEKSGTPYLMEVNGRFWGSLQLAVDAGVDFPENPPGGGGRGLFAARRRLRRRASPALGVGRRRPHSRAAASFA